MPHVFLSYSRTDRALARRLIADLERAGVPVWSDRMLHLGGQWLTDISGAISEAVAVLLLASPQGLASKWVMREVSAAQATGVPIVPMLADGARYGDLPSHLAGVNGVDLDEDYDDALTKVIVAVEGGHIAASGPASHEQPARGLLIVSRDRDVIEAAARVCTTVGLETIRLDPVDEPTAAVQQAHVVLLDAGAGGDVSFLAGYALGAGRWVICLGGAGLPPVAGLAQLPFDAALRFDADLLEAEICRAAFQPLPTRPQSSGGIPHQRRPELSGQVAGRVSRQRPPLP